MGRDRCIHTLKGAGVTLFDCDHRTPKQTEVGLPYVTIPQMKEGEIDLQSARKISVSDFADWTRKTKPNPGDVILSRRCNPGETAVVRRGQEFALGQNLVLLRTDETHLRAGYLRWLARSPVWWAEVERYRNPGAVFDSLRCSDILKFTFSLPNLSEQDAATQILDALDDKIQLNRQMAETLEATAHAIFKSWFVYFDPVHAKLESGGAQLPKDLSALFPNAFDGGLPVGWSISTVGEMFEVSGGNTPSTTAPENWGGPHEWATPKDLSGLVYPILLDTERRISDLGLSRSSSGLLPPGTLLLSSRAPIGYMAFASRPVAINQGFAGFVSRDVSTAYAWCWCSENMPLIRASASGSTFPEISKSTLRRLPMLRPPEAVLSAFDGAVSPLIDGLVAAATQSRTLATLRDTLLPKLITGELRIRDAERKIAAA